MKSRTSSHLRGWSLKAVSFSAQLKINNKKVFCQYIYPQVISSITASVCCASAVLEFVAHVVCMYFIMLMLYSRLAVCVCESSSLAGLQWAFRLKAESSSRHHLSAVTMDGGLWCSKLVSVAIHSLHCFDMRLSFPWQDSCRFSSWLGLHRIMHYIFIND